MIRRALSLVSLAALLGSQLLFAPAASAHAADSLSLPPPAKLAYSVSASQKGLKIGGQTEVSWQADGERYETVLTTRAMLVGKILEERSSGHVTADGLAPEHFTEKRLRRDPTKVRFDHAAGTARFISQDKQAAVEDQAQDRASALWQLIAMARAAPEDFKPGSIWTMPVAGRRDMQTWTFEVVGRETLDTPLGKLETVQVLKLPRNEDRTEEIAMWLAPAKEWYPVKLRYTEDNGDYIEQMIKTIDKQ